MDPFSEVLVHISAPSGVADDARYRAQVDAILGFQCVSRQAVINSAGSNEDTQDNGDQRNPHPGIQSPEHHAADSLNSSLVSVIPDSQPSQGPPLKRPRIHPPSPSPASLPGGAPGNPGNPGDPEETGNPPQPSTSSPRTHHRQQSPPPPPSTQKQETEITLPLQIHPPNPPPSTSPFTTHITPTLSMLITRLKSPRTYTPIHQTRALTNLERGHWTVPINLITTTTTTPPSPSPNPENKPQDLSPNTWPTPLFTRFWTFLSDFICEGRAGWGVWCSLEADTTTTTNKNSNNEGQDPHPQQSPKEEESKEEHKLTHPTQPTTLKIYAWGETAEHIYLLLFLASERRIRRMGARWRDSRDEVVIVM
ncbi:uncharacterized protein BDW47DRAFT_104492 [Aspergillus candidus]|uniref:Uncharacterized protein n=1 Tax=Aspergillus candidus TaxID=41067 RepID=A0A2I2FE64_ASPCN|nr:hypothetical protein BDW47DRAFT_104492 [Aspergillus candidus]PLB38897.1 hypothetical protein BDW47DRAFT_104492 [Aspergillus candidus]